MAACTVAASSIEYRNKEIKRIWCCLCFGYLCIYSDSDRKLGCSHFKCPPVCSLYVFATVYFSLSNTDRCCAEWSSLFTSDTSHHKYLLTSYTWSKMIWPYLIFKLSILDICLWDMHLIWSRNAHTVEKTLTARLSEWTLVLFNICAMSQSCVGLWLASVRIRWWFQPSVKISKSLLSLGRSA